jgi:HSP20 family protein
MMRDLSTWDSFQRTLGPRQDEFMPNFEVRETPDSYEFKADLPGVKEEDVEISVTGNRLTISGQRQQEGRLEGETYYAVERSYGSFSRTFTLPEGCDLEHVKAELKGGVLTLVVPKKEASKPRRISLQGLKEGIKESVESLKEGVKESVEGLKERVAGKSRT